MSRVPRRLTLVGCLLVAGCATPEYAVRQTPAPDESASAVAIERDISRTQGDEFDRDGGRPIGDERLRNLPVQQTVDRLSRVTERPGLPYRAYLYVDQDPNAAALADGRVYLSTGMINYLASRGSRADELAFIVGHELAHTVAQHLVKRYQMLQRQQLLIALVSAGAAAATRNASEGVQHAGRLAVDAAGMLRDVANSGYSQEQELEADQLGIRYVIRAGFDPNAALALLDDFGRFDTPWPFLRTHPYIATRREYVRRYLEETVAWTRSQTTARAAPPPRGSGGADERLRQLRQLQRSYPEGSVSWHNLQRQIDALQQANSASR